MVTRVLIRFDGQEACVSVFTDNGGDQSYGPYFSGLDAAKKTARSIVEQDFDESWNEKLLAIALDGDEPGAP